MIKPILIGAVVFLGIVLLVGGVRLGLLVRSLSSYKTYWQKEASKAPEPGAITYLALGDSTAQGIGATSPRRGYVGLVAKYLQNKTGKPVHVINISVSGAKINDAIKTQLPQLKSLPKPDYVTIEIGANDVPIYEKEKFKKEFIELMSGLPQGTYVANMPSFGGGRAYKANANATKATELIAELLTERPDLHLVDVNATTTGQHIWDFGADLFHPSNHGYKNWERAFTASIDAHPNNK